MTAPLTPEQLAMRERAEEATLQTWSPVEHDGGWYVGEEQYEALSLTCEVLAADVLALLALSESSLTRSVGDTPPTLAVVKAAYNKAFIAAGTAYDKALAAAWTAYQEALAALKKEEEE